MNLSSRLMCHICGQEVDGVYYTDHYGRISCDRHPVCMCYCCARLCDSSKSVKVDPYGYFCPECMKREVTSESAVRIANYINGYYRSNGFVIPDYSLELVSAEKMVAESGETAALGLAYSTQPYKILILRRVSRTGLAGVLAHEVLHLWQYRHNLKLPHLLCEGMCELGSYQFLRTINRQEADCFLKRLEKNNDQVYGEGFRLLNSVYMRQGWKGVVRKLVKRSESGNS